MCQEYGQLFSQISFTRVKSRVGCVLRTFRIGWNSRKVWDTREMAFGIIWLKMIISPISSSIPSSSTESQAVWVSSVLSGIETISRLPSEMIYLLQSGKISSSPSPSIPTTSSKWKLIWRHLASQLFVCFLLTLCLSLSLTIELCWYFQQKSTKNRMC